MSTSRVRQRHPTAVRRQLIIECASKLIAENGLVGTGAREIARAAGVSPGTVTYHFATVDEILMEVVRAAMSSFAARRAERVDKCTTFLSRLLVYLGVCFDEEVHPRSSWRLWLDCWAEASRHDDLRRYQVGYYRRLYAEIEALVRGGIDAGEFVSVPADDCAREFVALVDGLGEQMMIDAALTPKRARAFVEGAVRRRLGVPTSARSTRSAKTES